MGAHLAGHGAVLTPCRHLILAAYFRGPLSLLPLFKLHGPSVWGGARQFPVPTASFVFISFIYFIFGLVPVASAPPGLASHLTSCDDVFFF